MGARNFGRELFGLFLLFLALFLLLALASFDEHDPSLNQVVTSAVKPKNMAGMFGAYVSGFLNDIFGVLSFLWPLVFAFLGVTHVSPRLGINWSHWCGWFLLVICFFVLASACDFSIGHLSRGGQVGDTIYAACSHYLSPFGTAVVWFFLFLSSMQLIFGISWLAMLDQLVGKINKWRQARQKQLAGQTIAVKKPESERESGKKTTSLINRQTSEQAASTNSQNSSPSAGQGDNGESMGKASTNLPNFEDLLTGARNFFGKLHGLAEILTKPVPIPEHNSMPDLNIETGSDNIKQRSGQDTMMADPNLPRSGQTDQQNASMFGQQHGQTQQTAAPWTAPAVARQEPANSDVQPAQPQVSALQAQSANQLQPASPGWHTGPDQANSTNWAADSVPGPDLSAKTRQNFYPDWPEQPMADQNDPAACDDIRIIQPMPHETQEQESAPAGWQMPVDPNFSGQVQQPESWPTEVFTPVATVAPDPFASQVPSPAVVQDEAQSQIHGPDPYHAASLPQAPAGLPKEFLNLQDFPSQSGSMPFWQDGPDHPDGMASKPGLDLDQGKTPVHDPAQQQDLQQYPRQEWQMPMPQDLAKDIQTTAAQPQATDQAGPATASANDYVRQPQQSVVIAPPNGGADTMPLSGMGGDIRSGSQQAEDRSWQAAPEQGLVLEWPDPLAREEKEQVAGFTDENSRQEWEQDQALPDAFEPEIPEAPARRPEYAPVPLPSTELLMPPVMVEDVSDEELQARGEMLMQKLGDFGVTGELVRITPGPVVTMFEMRPSPGIRVSRVLNLADDIALGLKALSVRIQAPIPGTDTVGIEVPNEHRQMVNFRELAESDNFVNGDGPLTMILGKDIAGRPYMADLSTMPHLLVAGATGAGKSVCLNGILVSLLYRTQPRDMRLLLVDPKRIEMSGYADEPHLIHPVVTEPEDAQSALDWAVSEMDRRFKDMARLGARNISSYNRKLAERKDSLPPEYADLEHMPYLVIVIDELADLMMTAGREVEQAIVRLAQLARAAGIHMILATQRPSVDVVTGLIKANFPCRISFQVTSMSNSRTILDQGGAERLLGKGDMLFKPSGKPLVRLHGPYLSDDEVHSVVKHWKYHLKPSYEVDFASLAQDAGGNGGNGGKGAGTDPLYKEVVAFVMEHGSASTSLVQRHFRIGYNRAATIMDQLQEDGLVGPANGSKPRAVIR